MQPVVRCVKQVIFQIIKENVKVAIKLENVNNANKLKNIAQNVNFIILLLKDPVNHV